LWRAAIKIGEKRCCLDLTVVLPCLESSCKTREKKKGVSGFVGSRSSKTRLITVKIKKIDRFHRGLTGWTGSRVDRVSPDQFPSGFLPQPGPVPGPGRPAGPVRVLKL
jgi:hypothetical protein